MSDRRASSSITSWRIQVWAANSHFSLWVLGAVAPELFCNRFAIARRCRFGSLLFGFLDVSCLFFGVEDVGEVFDDRNDRSSNVVVVFAIELPGAIFGFVSTVLAATWTFVSRAIILDVARELANIAFVFAVFASGYDHQSHFSVEEIRGLSWKSP